MDPYTRENVNIYEIVFAVNISVLEIFFLEDSLIWKKNINTQSVDINT